MLIWTYLDSIFSKRSPNLPSGHDYLEPQRLAAIQETHMAQSRIVAIDAQDSEAPEHGYMGGQPPVGLLMHQNQATGFKVYTICGRTTGP